MLVLLGCAVPPADEAVTKRNSQLALEMKVKGALVTEPSLAAAAIEVTSSDHTVTLGGFVETQTQRQRAAEVAHEVAGVKKIVNNITVK
jgi:hyperosmotically inducible protein